MFKYLKPFIIIRNEFLKKDIQAYYIYDYVRFREPNNPDFLVHLKNTGNKTDKSVLQTSAKNLLDVFNMIIPDLNLIDNIDCICVVPRSKKITQYHYNELLFLNTVKQLVSSRLDGTDYIVRHTNTRTTHLSRSEYANFGGDGSMPYVGITKDTCTISPNVRGRNILLIDDIYTKTVNIDEDCIQALLDNGAKSVVFLAIGRTTLKRKI